MRAAFPPQINDNPAAILLLSGSSLTAGECRKMPPKKRACPCRQAPNAYNNHKIGGLEMSRRKCRNGTNTMQRRSYAEYGIERQRLEELQSGCRTGIYPPEILKAACRGLEAISPWILLSVRQGKSFDTLAVRWELGEIEKPPFCRTDFYSCRRRFFANLDKELKERGAQCEVIQI